MEALQELVRGTALDLLDALGEVERADTIAIVACDRDGMPSIHCTLQADGERVWTLSLVDDEVSSRGDGDE